MVWWCYGLNMCFKLNTQCNSVESGAFERPFDHKGSVLINGLMAVGYLAWEWIPNKRISSAPFLILSLSFFLTPSFSLPFYLLPWDDAARRLWPDEDLSLQNGEK